ncbi:TadE family protein [Kitasatospora sp. NPDC085879]|jgi:Flp pilus assembly protein TadG|uniref:TadE/TadG family type IV pilus assembly protein n=1 Tax=Kitasatospora sp. NPDC085879 TaxID=3154769 RepID=UPI0034301F7D
MMRRLRRLIEHRRAQGRDSGMSTVEFVIGTPIIFGLLFLLVQFALFFFADQVALAAAQAAAREARATADADPGGWQDRARTVALNRIASLGPALTRNPDVVPESTGPNQVKVTVRVQVVNVIPWLSLTATATSEGPVERFVPDAG